MEPLLQQTVSVYAEKILFDYCTKIGTTPEIRFEKLLRKDFGSSSPSGLGPQFRAVVSFSSPLTGHINVECIAPNKKTARRKAAASLLTILLGHPGASPTSEVVFTPQAVSSAVLAPAVGLASRGKLIVDNDASNNSASGTIGIDLSTRTDSSTTASAGSDGFGSQDCEEKDGAGRLTPPFNVVEPIDITAKTSPSETTITQANISVEESNTAGSNVHVHASAKPQRLAGKQHQHFGHKKSKSDTSIDSIAASAAGEFHSIHVNATKLAHMQFFSPHISGEVVRTVYAHSEMQMRAAFHWATTFTNEVRRLALMNGKPTSVKFRKDHEPESATQRPIMSVSSPRGFTPSSGGNTPGILPAGTPIVTPVAFDGVNFGYTVSALPFPLPMVPPGSTGFVAVPPSPPSTATTTAETAQHKAETRKEGLPEVSNEVGSGLVDQVRLRVAAAEDVPHIMRMIRELAEFEREPHAVKTDERTLLRDGFGGNPAFHVMLAELPTHIVDDMKKGIKRTHAAVSTPVVVPAAVEMPEPTVVEPAAPVQAVASAQANKSWASIVKGPDSVAPAPVVELPKETPAPVLPGQGKDSPLVVGASDWTPVGMAFCYVSYSTWEGRVLFLEDLYISPTFRRQGISRLLFTALARAAHVGKCARMQWTVLNWNEAAVSAYRTPPISAKHLDDWDIYRITAGDIARLADAPSVIVT